MNVRDVVYETARQFAEIAASQKWIEARVGDLNAAASEIRKALENQRDYFNEVFGIARKKKAEKRKEMAKKRKQQSKKRNQRAKKRKATPSRRKENQPK